MIIITFLLLITAFALHVIWWRYKMPTNTIVALLKLFTAVLLLANVVGYHLNISDMQLIQYDLLYVSCALVYIILYTAIEKQSPTLAIIHALYRAGNKGCHENELSSALAFNAETEERFTSLKASKWINVNHDLLTLNKPGKIIAAMFEISAKLFHLKKGG